MLHRSLTTAALLTLLPLAASAYGQEPEAWEPRDWLIQTSDVELTTEACVLPLSPETIAILDLPDDWLDTEPNGQGAKLACSAG